MVDQNLEIKTVAQTLYGEARGEGDAGMTAVADVIANRVGTAKVHVEEHDGDPHPLFGDGTFADCCKRHNQFSCWNPADPNLPKLLHVTIGNAAFLSAMRIATAAVTGTLIDETKGATHYRRVGSPASWADGKEPCVVIGHHEFFNNIT